MSLVPPGFPHADLSASDALTQMYSFFQISTQTPALLGHLPQPLMKAWASPSESAQHPSVDVSHKFPRGL